MLKTVRDLFRYNLEFALGAILILIVFGFAAASFFSPYPPMDSYVVAPDVPPSWAYPNSSEFLMASVSCQNTSCPRELVPNG